MNYISAMAKTEPFFPTQSTTDFLLSSIVVDILKNEFKLKCDFGTTCILVFDLSTSLKNTVTEIVLCSLRANKRQLVLLFFLYEFPLKFFHTQ